ncbi:hypothetical protein Syun_004558 [Stephania yunnanensis]|uniref:Uncharacterized protein n=1 Tax=Stephania yunnanensis TaxID=152371 RepID=A0AAP0L3G2_9MAGN
MGTEAWIKSLNYSIFSRRLAPMVCRSPSCRYDDCCDCLFLIGFVNTIYDLTWGAEHTRFEKVLKDLWDFRKLKGVCVFKKQPDDLLGHQPNKARLATLLQLHDHVSSVYTPRSPLVALLTLFQVAPISYIIPLIAEQPGPPVSQRIKGSLEYVAIDHVMAAVMERCGKKGARQLGGGKRTKIELVDVKMTTNEEEAGCDELFGDCKFVSSSNHSNQQQHNEDEDDWGDFVDNFSNTNNNHDLFPSHSSDGFNNLLVNGFFSGQNPSGGAYDATRDLDPFYSSCVESDVNLNSGSAVEKRWEKLRGAKTPRRQHVFIYSNHLYVYMFIIYGIGIIKGTMTTTHSYTWGPKTPRRPTTVISEEHGRRHLTSCQHRRSEKGGGTCAPNIEGQAQWDCSSCAHTQCVRCGLGCASDQEDIRRGGERDMIIKEIVSHPPVL